MFCRLYILSGESGLFPSLAKFLIQFRFSQCLLDDIAQSIGQRIAEVTAAVRPVLMVKLM